MLLPLSTAHDFRRKTMVTNLNIPVDDDVYLFLKKYKKHKKWITFFLDLIKEVYGDEP